MKKEFNIGDRVRSKFYGVVGTIMDIDTDGYILKPDTDDDMWIADTDAEPYDPKTAFLSELKGLLGKYNAHLIAHKTDMPISVYFEGEDEPCVTIGKEVNKGCGIVITPDNIMEYDKE